MLNKTRFKTPGAVSWLAATGISAAAVITTAKIVKNRRRPALDLRGKTVLITGGSRGLGFALAQEFGDHGCRLALCARNEAELEQASSQLANRGIEARPFVCDIGDASTIEPLVARVGDEFGQIDVLINNAGYISVGTLETFEHSDFERAMDVMFWAPLNFTFAVLPRMKRRGAGHIVNITSVGGRVSVPHLLPYSCAKFALVGFSTGLSTELRANGIHVLTAVPGLMRTGSYLNAEFRGAAKDEFRWFGLLGNLPGFTVTAEYAARSIRKAVEQQRYICTISLPAKLLIASEAAMPEITRTALELVNRRVLPASSQVNSFSAGKNLNSQLGIIFQALTSLGRTAARHLNE